MRKQTLKLGYCHLRCWLIIYEHHKFSFFACPWAPACLYRPRRMFSNSFRKDSSQISWLFSWFKACTKCWQLMPWAKKACAELCWMAARQNREMGWTRANVRIDKAGIVQMSRRRGVHFRWAVRGLQLMEFITLNTRGSVRENRWSGCGCAYQPGEGGKFKLNFVTGSVNANPGLLLQNGAVLRWELKLNLQKIKKWFSTLGNERRVLCDRRGISSSITVYLLSFLRWMLCLRCFRTCCVFCSPFNWRKSALIPVSVSYPEYIAGCPVSRCNFSESWQFVSHCKINLG